MKKGEYINRIVLLNENEREHAERLVSEGFTYLKRFDNSLLPTTPPLKIVNVLQRFVYTYRRPEGKLSRKEKNELDKLDFLFAQQVIREYGWSWYMHELREQVIDDKQFIVVSPDKVFYWTQFGSFISRLSGIVKVPVIEDLFSNLSIDNLSKELEEHDAANEAAIKAHPEMYENYARQRYGKIMQSAFLTRGVDSLPW